MPPPIESQNSHITNQPCPPPPPPPLRLGVWIRCLPPPPTLPVPVVRPPRRRRRRRHRGGAGLNRSLGVIMVLVFLVLLLLALPAAMVAMVALVVVLVLLMMKGLARLLIRIKGKGHNLRPRHHDASYRRRLSRQCGKYPRRTVVQMQMEARQERRRRSRLSWPRRRRK